MNKKKENVEVNWGLSQIWRAFLVFNFWTVSPDLEEDDDIEEEGDEDVEDAAEDPGGEGRESDGIWWSCPQSWDEQVDQHLKILKI